MLHRGMAIDLIKLHSFSSCTFKLFCQLYNLYIVHQSDSLIAGEKKYSNNLRKSQVNQI